MKSPFTIFRRLARALDALERIDRRLEGVDGLRSLTHHSPAFGPTTDAVKRDNPKWVWPQGHINLGASLKALERLGRETGDALWGQDFAGAHGFFVRQELVTEELFLPPHTSERHFEPKKRMFFTPKRPANQDDASSFFREND